MKRATLNFATRQMFRLLLAITCISVTVGAGQGGLAQDTPLLSGGVGFATRTQGGDTIFYPFLQPVAAVPVGNHLLFESRGEIAEFFSPVHGKGYKSSSFKTVDYAQADIFAGPYLTIVGGEFLTPFGTYNERLTQIWLRTLGDFPLIWGLGTMNFGTSVGGMLRGSAFANRDVSLSYTAYYSGNTTNQYISSERSSGGRGELYFPGPGLEVGGSYGRSLGKVHENFEGADLWWEPIDSPFRFRSEYGRAPSSQGYWFETDYRLSALGGADSFFGRFEPVFRMQQTFRDKPDPHDGMPSVNIQEADFGLDYHLTHSTRINTSYSRQFSPRGNVNIWQTGIFYRMLFPVWKGK